MQEGSTSAILILGRPCPPPLGLLVTLKTYTRNITPAVRSRISSISFTSIMYRFRVEFTCPHVCTINTRKCDINSDRRVRNVGLRTYPESFLIFSFRVGYF